jgi:hypothetical protein
MVEQHYIDDMVLQLKKLKGQAEKAVAQIDDDRFFVVLDPEANSIAIIMKHVAGNMRSRWTNFLTSDGEKPDRNRDGEFVVRSQDSRADIMQAWEDGWKRTLEAISGLAPGDLSRTIHVRGEAHSVLEAINRQVCHYAAHVGQIVLLAKHYAGSDWQTLSIPRGKSQEFDVSKQGAPYAYKK